MTYPLRQLEATLHKVAEVTTTEIEREEEGCIGLYVFRDSEGNKHMWSPRPVTHVFHDVDTVAEADQIMFLCPQCFAKNNGPVGTHRVFVSFAERNTPAEAGSRNDKGEPSRWTARGTTLDDLVLTPSILLTGTGCQWHGFVGSSGIPPGHAG